MKKLKIAELILSALSVLITAVRSAIKFIGYACKLKQARRAVA